MIFLRALIFSSDITTQQATANMVKVYCATKNADIQALQDHVTRHGSPPYVPGIEAMAKIGGSPGMERLSAMGNPKYFERYYFDKSLFWSAAVVAGWYRKAD